MVKFYDTNSLLLKMDSLFEEERFAISSITLNELESIKTSQNKDLDVKYSAQRLLRLLETYPQAYDVFIFREVMLNPIMDKSLPINNDTRILATAIAYDKLVHPDETIFVTNDLSLKHIANLFFGADSVQSVVEKEQYKGYKEVTLNDEEMANFYSHPKENIFDLYLNQYLVIHDIDGQVVDKLCWTGDEGYRPIGYYNFNSQYIGDVKPMKGDPFQALAADSLAKNRITMLRGPAGSGKTLLSLGYLLYLLDRHKIDKIIVFCNTVATKDSAKLGYLPGSRDEKLLDSQIGNLLSSKLGGRIALERMIAEEKIVLLPMSDIRGYDTSGMNAGIYISEAQNLSVALMKLALQRIGEDSICIIDGDDKTQVDDTAFAGHNNGMKRVSQVFRGSEIYGEVELQRIYRSRIARLAEGL